MKSTVDKLCKNAICVYIYIYIYIYIYNSKSLDVVQSQYFVSLYLYVPEEGSLLPPLRSVGRFNFDKGFAYLTTTLIKKKRHIIIRTAILYNEINSGQIM